MEWQSFAILIIFPSSQEIISKYLLPRKNWISAVNTDDGNLLIKQSKNLFFQCWSDFVELEMRHQNGQIFFTLLPVLVSFGQVVWREKFSVARKLPGIFSLKPQSVALSHLTHQMRVPEEEISNLVFLDQFYANSQFS